MKNKYLGLTVLMALLLAMALSGCGSDEPEEPKDHPVIEDIDKHIEEEVNGAIKKVMFSYTNNSDYPITNLTIRMKLKDGVTEDEIDEINNKVDAGSWERFKKNYSMEDMYIELRYSDKLLPGETSKAEWFGIRTMFVKEMSQYEIFEDELTTIEYIGDDEKTYTVVYNHETEEYKKESSDE